MKHGKKPTLKQKKFLKANKLNPDNWLIVKDTLYTLEVVHRVTGTKYILDKNKAAEAAK